MSTWDDITKSAKDAASYTVKKTEEITNIAKLKIALHGEEGKLKECMANLGELYYNAVKSGEEIGDEADALVNTANEIGEKINTYKSQIANIQGHKLCSSCGKQYSSDYDFCPYCGKKDI